MRRLRAILAPLAGLALLGGAAACTWHGLKPDDAGPKRLYIVGDLSRVGDERIVAAAAGYLDGGFFELDVDALRDAVAALPWVAEARVHRRWPDGVVVRVREHIPLALWGGEGVLATDGTVFRPEDSARPAGLSTLAGPEGTRQRLREMLPKAQAALAPIDARIARMSLDERGSWTAILADGLELRLGRSAVIDRLKRFAAYGPPVIGDALETAAYVDLRYGDGFAVGGDRAAPDKEAKDEQAA